MKPLIYVVVSLSLLACQNAGRNETRSATPAVRSTEASRANVEDQDGFYRKVTVATSPAEWVDIPTAGRILQDKSSTSGTLWQLDGPSSTSAAGPKDVWKNTDHVFGYVGATGDAIVHAGDMEPDQTLKGQAVKITLQRLRVADYPGDGLHRVLFDFSAKNQVQGGEEPLHFNQVYRVQEGGGAGIIGYPIFLGLNVGNNGLSFKAYTVNVSNDRDEQIMQFLESDVMKDGLKLAATAQPALVPFSQMALNITRMLASRRRNVPVQDAFVGLDFDNGQHGARLRTGDYIVVQTPANVTWRWSDWKYDKSQGRVVRRASPNDPIPYNYFVIGISRYAP